MENGSVIWNILSLLEANSFIQLDCALMMFAGFKNYFFHFQFIESKIKHQSCHFSPDSFSPIFFVQNEYAEFTLIIFETAQRSISDKLSIVCANLPKYFIFFLGQELFDISDGFEIHHSSGGIEISDNAFVRKPFQKQGIVSFRQILFQNDLRLIYATIVLFAHRGIILKKARLFNPRLLR